MRDAKWLLPHTKPLKCRMRAPPRMQSSRLEVTKRCKAGAARARAGLGDNGRAKEGRGETTSSPVSESCLPAGVSCLAYLRHMASMRRAGFARDRTRICHAANFTARNIFYAKQTASGIRRGRKAGLAGASATKLTVRQRASALPWKQRRALALNVRRAKRKACRGGRKDTSHRFQMVLLHRRSSGAKLCFWQL